MQQDDAFDVSEATVEYASPVSTDFGPDAGPVATAVANDTNLERVRDILFGSQARTTDKRMQRLDEREKQIIRLRFYEGRTQMEVASEIGISQAQVSRLEKNALKCMRSYLTG